MGINNKIMKIDVVDIDWDKYFELPRKERKEPDFSKINFPLTIGMKIGLLYRDDKEYWDSFSHDDGFYEDYDSFKLDQCHRAIVVPYPSKQARGNIDPSEVILCFYDYPCEKENPTCDFVTLSRVMTNDEVYEVFPI